jgi:predicted Zn-dependent protease with MMP-like domain
MAAVELGVRFSRPGRWEAPWRAERCSASCTRSVSEMRGTRSEQDFDELVRAALDGLPVQFQRALKDVAVVVSDRGAEHHAYGLYVGYTMTGSSFFGGGGVPDEILIFRDTLVRDFGDDPECLRSQVIQTLRHELGHYLGFDEADVRKLGL